MRKVGVLALQGDFTAHQKCLEYHRISVQQIREPADLEGIEGLVLPGGESTVLSRLLVRYGLFDPLHALISSGIPVFATCAGLILLSSDCTPTIPKLFSLLPIQVRRNAYGPQTESTYCLLHLPFVQPEPLPVHFIRAPLIENVAPSVKVLATWKDSPILVHYKNILGATFHPELDPKTPFYSYWLNSFFAPSSKAP